MTEGDWALGTFEGVRRDQARRAATASVTQRLAWLEDMLRLALASGALQRERDLKQRAIDRVWLAPGA
jgi:hypothetical protein